jgi:hypothetical protein
MRVEARFLVWKRDVCGERSNVSTMQDSKIRCYSNSQTQSKACSALPFTCSDAMVVIAKTPTHKHRDSIYSLPAPRKRMTEVVVR